MDNSTSKAVGIDLGTTNSVAAFKWNDVEVVTHDSNTAPDRKLTRSAVAWRDERFVAGNPALNQGTDDQNLVVSVKRLMGRGFQDPNVQAQLGRFKYRIVQPADGTAHAVAIKLGDAEFQPEDISAEILKQVARNAQEYLAASGKTGTVKQAVITIPAYFDDKQRDATRKAAERAGLELLELLPEPTAAAISYGMIPGVSVNSVLVYDFGGGTFDASLLVVGGNTFIEVSKAGNLWLGGDDIDHQLMDHVLAEVARTEELEDVPGLIERMPRYERLKFENDLRRAIEQAKVDLSNAETVRILPATPLLDEMGLAVQVDVTVTRGEFEAMIAPKVRETLEIAKKAVFEGQYTLDMVEKVLLVGGSSQIPLVQRLAREAFGADKVVTHPRPMTAVAEGAALRAAGQVEKVGSVSRDYCIRLVNDPQYFVIRRNETLPYQQMFNFKTVQDGQRLVCFEFFSPDWVSGKEDPIGKMWLALDEDFPKGTTLQAFLELEDGSEVLKVTACVENAPHIKVSRTFTRGKADEVVFDELQALITEANGLGLTSLGVSEANRIGIQIVQAANQMLDERTGMKREDQHDRADQGLRELRSFSSPDVAQAEFLSYHIETLLETCDALIPSHQAARLGDLKRRLDDGVQRHDLSILQATNEEALQELKSLPSEVQVIRAMMQAIQNANTAGSTDGSLLASRLSRIVTAFEEDRRVEAARLMDESAPLVDRWLRHETEDQRVVTGIAR